MKSDANDKEGCENLHSFELSAECSRLIDEVFNEMFPTDPRCNEYYGKFVEMKGVVKEDDPRAWYLETE
jgi:hypothetical protein